MADFWIKVEKGTPDKPEVFEIAEILQIDPDAVLGKLIRVWCWLDSNSENGHIKTVTHVLIDRLTSHKGFAESMVRVGWLTSDGVPNFSRHLGESSKKRAKDSERKRKSRETSEECHTKTVTKIGLDKIRVDKIVNPSVDQQVDLEEVIKNEIDKAEKKKYTEDDRKISEWIYSRVLIVSPKAPKPNFDSWANTIRLMRESDKTSRDDICSVFEWANRDEFWKTNILSPKKLREKFSTLHSKMINPKPMGYMSAIQAASASASIAERMNTPDDLEF